LSVQTNPFLKKLDDGKIVITREGVEFLDSFVTNTSGSVYSFKPEGDPLIVAAAMARLSRRGSDLREIVLDEFANTGEAAEGIIDRVVTQFGDDSVSQLVFASLVVEDSSNLLTKLLEWGRLMAYLEQSTRYIFFDVKDASGRFRYFVPEHLPIATKRMYEQHMDWNFVRYSEIVRALTAYVREKHPEPTGKKERTAWLGATRAQACDAARPTLPVATKSTVGIVGSAQAIDSLIRHLLASTLPEAQETGRKILTEMRKVIPAFLKRTDLPDRGVDWALYMRDTASMMKRFVEKSLPDDSPEEAEKITLVDYFPKDELDLVPRMLHAPSKLSILRIMEVIGEWNTSKKLEVFAKYIGNRRNRRHKPGRALEFAHYEFEVCADYGTFRDLQRHRMVDEWEWQHLTCDYGFDVPQLVQEAGLELKFRECFEKAGKMHQSLKVDGFTEEAQYATLLGHRMRYRFTMNAREAYHLLELRTAPQGHPGYRRICKEMHRQIAEVHPRVAAGMTFINKNPDQELTRLESERATQAKLELLENTKE